MITRRTKLQLLVFVIITLVGVSYVGARYAQLDRLFYDSSYTVVAHLERSGGIFAGGEVTYRGVGVGQVDKLELTDEGVDVYLAIENDYDSIPADTLAVVGNRSAVGEQYVELQPKAETEPYLEQGSEIALEDTRTPIATETLLEQPLDHGRLGRPGGPAHHGQRARARPSPAPARTCSASSTPATPSSRPPTTTSTSPPR